MDTTIRRATPIDVLHALAPTTVFHMKVDRERVLEKLGALARRVPGYWLDAGTELEQIPPSILEHRGGMRVSVVIPAFDGERFLSDAVASVRAQECPIHEIVVVDDGSTDGTAELVERLGASVVQQQNEGPAAARNRGIEASDGEVIAFLDCDDVWTDGSLARRSTPSRATRSSRSCWVATGSNISPAPLLVEFPADEDGSITSVKFSSGVFRREVFERVGLLDTSFRQAEDVDWFLRALEQGLPMLIVDHVSLVYRRHSANVTCDRDLNAVYFARALRHSLERRRRTWRRCPDSTAALGGLDERHAARSRP